MPGKHRGPTLKGHVPRMYRFALTPEEHKAFEAMAFRERRSLGNMATVLIAEALHARAEKEKGENV